VVQGVKLYFRVMEGMLKAEQDRTGRSNFTSLLASTSFHKCLAACAFEVVIASYRMVRTSILCKPPTPYDCCLQPSIRTDVSENARPHI
jgi:hypothetical protein